jgi:hypothetical protein
MSSHKPDDLLAAVKADEKRMAAAAIKQRDADLARLARDVHKLRAEIDDLRRAAAQRDTVQRVLLEKPMSTGISLGIGFILAPAVLAILTILVMLIFGLGSFFA